MKRLRNLEWEAVAGALAAVVGLVLHLLGVVDQGVLLAVVLVILALMLINQLRREDRDRHVADMVDALAADTVAMRLLLKPPDALLIGPRALRSQSEHFARRARGEMTWFNVCLLMFVPQTLFDSMLRPAIENPSVTRIRFVLDQSERERWQKFVVPKIAACIGAQKVLEPHWSKLDEAVSFVLCETEDGRTEAQVSFWGEPFMSRSPDRDLPRYVFHIQPHSELISHLVDMDRTHRRVGDIEDAG